MFLQVDLCEAEGEFIVEAELPGVSPEEIELMVSTDRICISGCRAPADRPRETTGSPRQQHRRERTRGRFMREIPLPLPVLRESAEATLCDGVLTVRLVIRKQPAPAQRLPIKAVDRADAATRDRAANTDRSVKVGS